jgi:hypothetical protein
MRDDSAEPGQSRTLSPREEVEDDLADHHQQTEGKSHSIHGFSELPLHIARSRDAAESCIHAPVSSDQDNGTLSAKEKQEQQDQEKNGKHQ